METKRLGNSDRKKNAAIRKVVSGEMVECDCAGMVEVEGLREKFG
jgi:hypothetical protein